MLPSRLACSAEFDHNPGTEEGAAWGQDDQAAGGPDGRAVQMDGVEGHLQALPDIGLCCLLEHTARQLDQYIQGKWPRDAERNTNTDKQMFLA